MEKIALQIDEFMIYCQSKNLSKKTMASYEQTLKLFAKYLENEKNIVDVSKVSEKTIRGYINYIMDRGKYTVVAEERTRNTNLPDSRKDFGKKISKTTVNNYIRNIKVFFTYLKDQNIIKSNPMEKIKQLKNERKPQEFLNDEEFIRLLKQIETSKTHEYRDYIILLLLLDTGMRIGECLLIKTEDLDMVSRSILLPSANTKSKRDRYVYFSQDMQKELRRWLQYKDRYIESDYLFPTSKGNPLLIRTFEKKMKEYGERAKLKDIHPHMLRNNFAKRFLMAGGNIYTLSKILGHSSVTVTEKAYLDLTDADIRKSYQQFSPLSNLKKK